MGENIVSIDTLQAITDLALLINIIIIYYNIFRRKRKDE
jgi:hypothetical protein